MPSKKNSSKIKFAGVTGRKKVLLITMCAFVVIGAGIIIRSFAATPSQTYSVANNGLINSLRISPDLGIVNDTSNGNVIQVMRLKQGDIVLPKASRPNILANKKWRVCAVARGLTSYTSFRLRLDFGYGIKEDYFPRIESTWTPVCSSIHPSNSIAKWVDISIWNNNSTWVNLAYIYVEYM